MSEQPPNVYRYSVKLEMGAKGDIKPTIHVYSNDVNKVRGEAITLLHVTIDQLKHDGFMVPKIEKEN